MDVITPDGNGKDEVKPAAPAPQPPMLTIVWNNGSVNVVGNVPDLVMALGMIELAKAAIFKQSGIQKLDRIIQPGNGKLM